MATGTGYSAGRVYLQVVPSYRDFMKALRRDAKGSLGQAIADTFEKELGQAGYNASERAGSKAADGLKKGLDKKLKGDAFARDIRKSIDGALEHLGDTSEQTATRLKNLRKEFDSGSKSANEVRRDLDALGESLHRVGQDDGNVQVATNAREASKAILGATEVNRRYREESARTSKEVSDGAKEVSRAHKDAERAERSRNREGNRSVEGNNRAQRSLFSLRNALTGVSGDSNDGANAFRFFNGALLAAVAIGPALIPVLAGVAGGLALLLPILLGIGAGAGVAILGFSGIAGAVKALGDQERATSKDSLAYQRSVQMAARGVADARRGLQDAYRNSAEAIAAAIDRQADAERRLRDAQRDAKKAQADLTEARVQAKQELLDLDNQVAQNQLDERQGVIDLFNAYNQYGAVQADGGSTNLEREQADIALKQAQLNLKRIREEQKQLAAEKKKADKGGVNGTDTVRNAEERLTAALEKQKDARRDLAKASMLVDRARADGARSVADAQRNLNRAQEDYAYALQGGVEQADKLREAMDKLSPAGQKFALFIFSLRKGFRELRAEVQERFLPGVQDAMQRIIDTYGPGFSDFVKGMASDLGDLSRKFGKVFTSKLFRDFFKAFGPAARQFTRDFGNTVLSLMEGFVAIMDVALPYARRFSKYIADTAKHFAAWADSEEGRKKVRKFFEYIDRVAPIVRDFFKAFLGFALKLAEALAPIGESVLKNLTTFFDYLSRLDPTVLTLLAAGIASIIVALQVSSGLVAFISLVGIISGSGFLIAVAAVGALAASFYFLGKSGGDTQKKFEKLMEKLQPTIDIFKEIGRMIYDNLVKVFKEDVLPALKEIATYFIDEFLPAFNRFYPVIKPLIKFMLYLSRTIIGGFIQGLRDAIVGALKLLTGIMDFITGVFTGNWGLAWHGLGEIVHGAIRLIWGLLQLLPIRALKYVGKFLGKLVGFFGKAFTKGIPGLVRRGLKGLIYIIKQPLKVMSSLFSAFKDDAISAIKSLIKKLPELLGKLGGFFGKKLGNPIIDLTDFVLNNVLIKGVNRIAGFVHLPKKLRIPKIQLPHKFHTGGIVDGPYSPGRDNRMIQVGGGEAILRPEATRALGADTINRLNSAAGRGGRHAVDKMLGFAKGGIVWPTKSKHWTTYAGHDGIDLNGKGNGLGDPYFATAAGRVIYTGAGRGYGNKVELSTVNNGPTVIYGHSSKIRVKAGDRVKAGQVLGNIGYSGHVRPAGPAGSHLHFGIKGEPADEGALAIRYLGGAKVRSGGGGVVDKLAGLSKSAIAIIKNPEGYFKKRITRGLTKVGGLTGDFGTMLKSVPKSLLGGIVEWAKAKAMSGLGLAKSFFKYSPLGLGLKGLRAGVGRIGDIPGIGNPFGGKNAAALYDKGGYLPPGLSMVMNKTRQPEPVLTGAQWKLLADRSISNGGDTINATAYGADPEQVVNDLFTKLNREKRRVKRSGTVGRKVNP